MSNELPPFQRDSQELEVEQEVQPEQRVEKMKQRAKDNTSSPLIDIPTTPEAKTQTKKTSGLRLEAPKVTAGTGGARNITFEKYWVNVSNNFPCGFDVKTLPNNDLEVTMQQLSYRRTYNGRGAAFALRSAPWLLSALLARSSPTIQQTGEIVEQPWVWHLIGGSGSSLFSLLWNAIKRAIWPSK
jgi:hypothetical protein